MESFVRNLMEFSYSLVIYMAIPVFIKTFFEQVPREHIWKISLANSVIGFFYFVFDASIRGGISSIEAAIGWGIVSYFYLSYSYNENFGHRNMKLVELEQRVYEKDKQNTFLKAENNSLSEEIRRSLETINKLNAANSALYHECRYEKNMRPSKIIIDYKSKFFSMRDYTEKAKSFANNASEYWIIDVLNKKTIVYTLGENISIREVPFGWKIEEDSLDGYYQIYIHGMTNSERDALENRPVS